MTYKDTLKQIDKVISAYSSGLLSISETVKSIDNTISSFSAACNSPIDTRIEQTEKLFRHALQSVLVESRRKTESSRRLKCIYASYQILPVSASFRG